MAAGRVRGFSIATKCKTLDELIEKYRDRVDEKSILVSAVESRDIGTECAFAILLADKQIALAGTCTVLDVYTDANNPFGRPGMRLGIKRLGPDSERVFARLVAKRVPPRRLTRSVPVVVPAAVPMRTSTGRDGRISDAVQRRMTLPVVRAPQAAKSSEAAAPRAAVVQTRTPGSPYVLPANPLSSVTDASLEGFVDCKLHEADPVPAPPKEFPAGTREELETVAPAPPRLPPQRPAPATRTARASRPTERLGPAARVVASMRAARSGPLPLPLPPPPSVTRRPAPLPYAHTELPKLEVGRANDHVRANARIPLVPRRLRSQLLLAFALVPLIGAGAVIAYMQLFSTPQAIAAPAIAAPIASAELSFQTRATVDEPPPAPPAPPQPTHAVLVKTYPIAARVTVGDRYFGTTPTYIKIPANTPVEVHIERPGFAPVTYPFVSKTRTDRVFVRLQKRKAKSR